MNILHPHKTVHTIALIAHAHTLYPIIFVTILRAVHSTLMDLQLLVYKTNMKPMIIRYQKHLSYWLGATWLEHLLVFQKNLLKFFKAQNLTKPIIYLLKLESYTTT